MIKKQLISGCSALFLLINSSAITAQAQPTQPLQDPQQVADEVEHYLLNQADSYAGTASVHVNPPAIRNQTACEQLQPHLPSSAKLRSTMTVTVRCQKPQTWTLRVKAELHIDGYYYISNRTLTVGHVLSLDDMVPREGDLLRLPANSITDPSLAVDYITTQRINEGRPIKSSALRHPQSIERGQSVRTVANGQGFRISGEGTALQSANPGTKIQVRVSSGKVITGTAVDSHTVEVF